MMAAPPAKNPVLLLTLILFGCMIFYQSCAATPPAAPAITVNTPHQATATLAPSPSYTSTPQTLPTLTPAPTPLACPPLDAPRQVGSVVEIIDATHARVIIAGLTYRVKYLGLRAPLPGSTDSEKSKQKNAELTRAKSVTLLSGPVDKEPNGTLLRYIFVGETFVNLELLKLGYAARDPNDQLDANCQPAYVAASDAALLSGAGLFSGSGNPQFFPSPTLKVYYVLPTQTSLPRYFTAVPGSPQDIYDHNADGRVTCADFDTQADAREAYYAGYYNLDNNVDEIPCEKLP